MKKILIGILILIPIIILLIIALVSSLISVQAWVSVEDLELSFKNSSSGTRLELSLADLAGEKHTFDEFVDVKVMPERANRYTLEWSMSSLKCTDDRYEKEYQDYIETESGTPVPPAALLVDGGGEAVDSNSSGEFIVNAYCYFDVTVRAETVSKNFTVYVKGFTVESVQLLDVLERSESSLKVGESTRLAPRYSPLDSIVEEQTFTSDDPSVAVVDKNGVVTAVGEGIANVTVSASKYGEEGHVDSTAYTVTVSNNVSKFGASVVVERRSPAFYTFAELGLDGDDVVAGAGYALDENGVTLSGDSASLAIKDGGSFDISVVEQNKIAIQNASFFNYAKDGDYVLEVGPLKLCLTAVWASALKEGTPSVTWESSDSVVATVNANGEVTPLASGITVITARTADSQASVILNVQNKISSIRLLTSNTALSVGLARETIFAAQKYVYETDAVGGAQKDLKTPNSTLIRVQGEPEEGATQSEILYFYSSYRFEVIEGEEYAAFDEIDNHKLVFDPQAIDGKGMVDVKVRVSAKYPRYEGVQTHTVEEVTLKVAYGVEVSNWDQLMRASNEQRDYTERADYFTEAKQEAAIDAPNGTTYYVFAGSRTTGQYAIVMSANISVPADKVLTDSEEVTNGTVLMLYGALYGNDHMLSAAEEQVIDDTSAIIRIRRSGAKISNTRVRLVDTVVDDIHNKMFGAYAIHVVCELESTRLTDRSYRMSDISVEYSIIENALGAMRIYNADVNVTGCIIRNISMQGVYCWVGMSTDAEDEENVLVFDHLTMHNTVFDSIRAMSVSFDYNGYALKNEESPDGKGRPGRFGADPTDRQASYDFVENVLGPLGYIPSFKQTGFLDIYNWQDVANAEVIQFDNEQINSLVKLYAGKVIGEHPDFEPYVYTKTDEETGFESKYIHLGFFIAGIKPDYGADEYPIIDLELQDDRFGAVRCRDLSSDFPDNFSLQLGSSIFSQFEITFYSYKKDASLNPFSVFTLNSAMIDRLHS